MKILFTKTQNANPDETFETCDNLGEKINRILSTALKVSQVSKVSSTGYIMRPPGLKGIHREYIYNIYTLWIL
jgi:hypothetical protein